MAEPAAARGGNRGMGRGLSAILSNKGVEEAPGLREIAVELIRPNPKQPRSDFEPEALTALAESIQARGVLQPIVVRPLAGGSYELIAGERRLRAAKLAELQDDPRGRPRDGRGRAARARADREHGPRRPERHRGGARLRDARRRPRVDEGGARPPRRPQPRRDLEPDPAARAARRRLDRDRRQPPVRGSRPRAAARPRSRRTPAARPRRDRRRLVRARDRGAGAARRGRRPPAPAAAATS